MKEKYLILFFIITLLSTANAKSSLNISPERLNQIAQKYGKKAKKRFELLDKLIKDTKSKDILYKLKAVNDFWNRVKYKEDTVVWNKEDYWATPFEFLCVGAGDSEDYALAKYITLRILGIPKDKLKIRFTKLMHADGNSEIHIVLAYYHQPQGTPIVLDNIDKQLKLATKREDLQPIYNSINNI